ncbi:MAG TPA: nicotinate-nucleotide--dimethylbenzimidazole phosphoribosyltransferase [Solirubrobacteraceae bacterium]|nr:nicotinate-nucleotide--dimethylbenzimidazole phosphoribosyltransferase [Solirubrobacteraceae bacterium]
MSEPLAPPEPLRRPPTPEGFDSSRAAERAADPTAWRFEDRDREAVHRAIAQRRDIRRFRPDEVPDEVLRRVLEAAHRAPSVGLMQPWRFIVVRSLQTRTAVRAIARRERLRQADRFGERTRQFLDQKIEGVVEAPLGICVCCDHGDPAREVLGRGTIPETDLYSTACAIENLWLAARAEGLGVGWVSFYRPGDLRELLGIPDSVDPVAYLCVGWPDERPVRPGLETAGWASRLDLDAVLMHERWSSHAAHVDRLKSAARARAGEADVQAPHLRDGRAAVAPRERLNRQAAVAARARLDRQAAIAARDRLDRLVKPAGSLGSLEELIERWALICGSPPPASPRAGVLVCAADHGHLRRGTSLFGAEVSAQVAAAAARGQTAVGVLAAAGGHRLIVADLGLAQATAAPVRGMKIRPGTADMLDGPAMSCDELDAALTAGSTLARELVAGGVDCLALGEIGMGNTTTAAALACALTGAPPAATVGRGAGLDAAGVARKREVVAAAIDRHGAPLAARDALRAVGGLELAALTGAVLEAGRLRVPVLLDGYAVGVAALAAVRLDPLCAEVLIAAHRSAEPGHALVLEELGLEPLLDLRLRLGEASGALLALPIVGAAGALHSRMATFAEAGVSRVTPPTPKPRV